jgi:serine/threonine-protein kinase
MKYCPVCESKYGDEVELCVNDGATLKLFGARQDPFFGKLIKGRYQVHRKIGEGGMGTVYLAEQVSVGRKVALKLLQGSYASDDDFICKCYN